MRITLRLQAQLRQAIGRPRVDIEVPAGSDVAFALRTLAREHAPLARLLLTATGEVQPTLLLFRGDEQVDRADPLAEGDELTVLTPMAGG